MIRGFYFVNDYEIVLDFGQKYLTLKKKGGIRRHEFFYNTIRRTGNEIKLTAKTDHLTSPSHECEVCQISKSNACFEYNGKIKQTEQTNG